LQQHKRELNDLGIVKIRLFSSYARGDQSEKSDIDILVEFSPRFHKSFSVDKQNHSYQ